MPRTKADCSRRAPLSRPVPLGSRGRPLRHPEALQPQGQHHQHLSGAGAQPAQLLLQAGGGGRRLQQRAARYPPLPGSRVEHLEVLGR